MTGVPSFWPWRLGGRLCGFALDPYPGQCWDLSSDSQEQILVTVPRVPPAQVGKILQTRVH